ncbi:uncharacterized protein LOC127290979 [Leptopilina boulardi]|uniref:uncharacterized protein LOC127278504 n=1 Tax=Leptopilina boulardi TaxID=63433 RepID=UPI0021F511E7|nr:uncharacterized protein LOC127278504 [Leptopilina boulardi]XP_051175800.1 uncharacterized protein LOC127290979 [Leptopilina boulardi]
MEDEDVLNIAKPIVYNESIAHYEVHAHLPYASATFNNSDEIRIAVQNQDHCVLPSKSFLHIQGKLLKENGTPVTHTRFINNAICHLFEEARYELNAIEIDKNRNVGLTSLMKNYVSVYGVQSKFLENAGWFLTCNANTVLVDNLGNFDISIPFNILFGFAEDYQKIIVNARHELILTRARNDMNAILQTGEEQISVSINKIEWLLPNVRLSDSRKFKLLKYIEKDPLIPISFRTWELYEYPLLPQTANHVWTVKTSTQLEKPRFIILGFQTNRKNVNTRNASHFDHCKITNVKLFLNNQSYPYGNLNLDFDKRHYAVLYDMYANFQATYYNKEPQPYLSKNEFFEYAPLIVIDCSRQNESLKYGPVDIRLEFESKKNLPDQTAAYCLILHDRIVEYRPISGGVKKIV